MTLKIKGLDKVVDKLNKYVDTPERANKILYKLAKMGEDKLEATYKMPKIDKNHSRGGTYVIEPNITTGIKQEGNETTLWAEGENLLFFEFGAGVTHNTPRIWENVLNIQVPDEVMDIGTYGKGYGAYDHWFYYNENGDVVMTQGIKARAGFASVINIVVDNIGDVIKEVMNE